METIEDIVREMRAVDYGIIENPFVQFANCIEAAAKELTEENARLLAAIKPVLECEWTEDTPLDASWIAVSEAQRIFNESEAK